MAKKMTPETALKKTIKDYLKLSGWEVVYFLNYGIGVYKGISDFVAVKIINDFPVYLWIEAKSKNYKQSEDQIKFENLIKKNKGHYILAYSIYDIEKYIVKNFGEKNLLL